MELIVAVDENWGIGRNGTQPITLAADRMFFRDMTSGSIVIAGRKTIDDFPGRKPLPGRVNIVLSRTRSEIPGFIVCSDTDERKMYDDPNYPGTIVKAGYPFRNSRGMRKMPMYFIDEIAARAVIDGADVGSDTRKWLLQEVLTYRPFPEEPAESPPEPKATELTGTTYDEMSRAIDRMLIELLELKKLASSVK